jgi:pSer/pThr/pTyr-binding forkhead associated (FHA) protein
VLIPEKTLVMGRSTDADLSIPSQRVSRKHAEVFWTGGHPWLRDLGSQNGSQINGKRIHGEAKLQDGDEIVLGPFLCTYRYVAGGASGTGGVDDTNALTQPMVGDAMAGNLDQMKIGELLQTLEFNEKSGTLEVFGADGDGTLVIKEGKPTYAMASGKLGNDGVLEIMSWSEGQFSFSPDLASDEVNVQGTITGLLMEAMRRVDEGG